MPKSTPYACDPAHVELVALMTKYMGAERVTQHEMAARLDVTPTTLCRWLSGMRKISISYAAQIRELCRSVSLPPPTQEDTRLTPSQKLSLIRAISLDESLPAEAVRRVSAIITDL